MLFSSSLFESGNGEQQMLFEIWAWNERTARTGIESVLTNIKL